MATARGRETGQQSRKSVNEALSPCAAAGRVTDMLPARDSMEPSLVARWDLGQRIATPRDQAPCGGAKRAAANSFLRRILAESKMPPRLQRKFTKSFQLVAMRSRRETMCQRSDLISAPKARGYVR
jgi:hypothetical protein